METEKHLITIGDVKVTKGQYFYYVRHATTEKLIAKTVHKDTAYSLATRNSDYKGNSLNTGDPEN